MTRDQAIYFRNRLRDARLEALRDAEGFTGIIHALERMGMFLRQKTGDLGAYQEKLGTLAGLSVLARKAAQQHPACHAKFSDLFDSVRACRNEAMHQGAVARHLTAHAIRLALVLEDAIMQNYGNVRDFMVYNPVCAQMWQPVSFIRQTMLECSFSHLPVLVESETDSDWKFVSEHTLVQFLRGVMPVERETRLLMSLKDASMTAQRDSGPTLLSKAELCCSRDSVVTVLARLQTSPILVQDDHTKEVIGILTAYDLL